MEVGIIILITYLISSLVFFAIFMCIDMIQNNWITVGETLKNFAFAATPLLNIIVLIAVLSGIVVNSRIFSRIEDWCRELNFFNIVIISNGKRNKYK